MASISITDSSSQMRRWIRSKDLKNFTAYIANNKGNLQFDENVVKNALKQAGGCCLFRNRSYLAALIPHMRENHLKINGPEILRQCAANDDYQNAQLFLIQAKTHDVLKDLLEYSLGKTSVLDFAVRHNNARFVDLYLKEGKSCLTKKYLEAAIEDIPPCPFRYTGTIRAALNKAYEEIERSTPPLGSPILPLSKSTLPSSTSSSTSSSSSTSAPLSPISSSVATATISPSSKDEKIVVESSETAVTSSPKETDLRVEEEVQTKEVVKETPKDNISVMLSILSAPITPPQARGGPLSPEAPLFPVPISVAHSVSPIVLSTQLPEAPLFPVPTSVAHSVSPMDGSALGAAKAQNDSSQQTRTSEESLSDSDKDDDYEKVGLDQIA